MKKKGRSVFLPALFCALSALALFSIYQLFRNVELSKYASTSEDRSYYQLSQTPSVTWQGSRYEYNTDISTIVFMGIDKTGALERQEEFKQAGQSDVVLLLSFNRKTKEYFLLPVNRDTMVDMTVYGIFGGELGTENHQLTLAYGYGDGGRTSGENTLNSLKTLLYRIPFSGYVAAPTDTVAIVNDAVGGITVTVDDDFASYDSSLVRGEAIRLQGEQAIHFVRGRMTIGDGTNEARMKRQEQFYDGLLEKFRAMNSSGLLDLYNQVMSYTKSNMSQSDVASFLSYVPDYAFRGIYHIDGISTVNNGFMEFYPDKNKLQELILSLYFTKEE